MDVRDADIALEPVSTLERLRLSTGLSQYHIERAVPIARKTLRSLERGEVRYPHMRTIERLARFYNVRPEWLLGVYRHERLRDEDIAA